MGAYTDVSPLILYPLSPHQHVGQCDCDCACALDVPSWPEEQLASGSWTRQVQVLDVPLNNEWRAYFNPNGPVGVAVLNAEAARLMSVFDSPLSLDDAPRHLSDVPAGVAREATETLAQIGLLCPVEAADPGSPQVSTLSAWLHVTEACNLRCPYCYVRKRPGTMNLEVARQAVERLVEMAVRHGYSTLKLKYAGGEPTLNFSLIQDIHRYAARRAEEAGISLEEVILTNGVGVPDAVLDFAARTGVRLMVSLDGGAATHDRMRTRRDGRGTYALVADTVERALAWGLRPDISITLTSLNLDGAVEAVAFALERGLPFNLNFYRECGGGEPAAGTFSLVPDPARLVDTMRDVFDLIKAYPTYPLPLTGILDRTRLDTPHSYPCSAGRDYVAIDTGGRVAACQMLLEEPWTDLDAPDPLEAIRQRADGVFQSADKHAECRTCPWRTACGGGCPLMRGTRLHDEYCQVYQALFPDLIRLEARRLITTHFARPVPEQ